LSYFLKEPWCSLDEGKKHLVAERDNLLKESREQQAKLDVINSQIERLSKVNDHYSV
jgi:predicted nuclease with TOPRIM domain